MRIYTYIKGHLRPFKNNLKIFNEIVGNYQHILNKIRKNILNAFKYLLYNLLKSPQRIHNYMQANLYFCNKPQYIFS